MRWLADECVAAALVDRLRGAGHDVSYVAEAGSGATDAAVLGLAHDEDRLLLTEDKDFGDLVFRSRRAVPGVVLLRLAIGEQPGKWARLEAAIAQFGGSLFGRYLVVEVPVATLAQVHATIGRSRNNWRTSPFARRALHRAASLGPTEGKP